MATQLTVTNEALGIIGEPPISDPNTNITAAREMLAVWTESINVVLEQAEWNFARKRVQLSLSATAPAWGYNNYYALPADWIRTIMLSPNGLQSDEIIQYQLENGLVACNENTVYLYYITSDAYTNTGSWPPLFAKWVAAEMAFAKAPRLNPAAIGIAQEACKLWQKMAKNSDQINQPPKRRHPGQWATARRVGFATNREQF
jgi:hypothetical protein